MLPHCTDTDTVTALYRRTVTALSNIRYKTTSLCQAKRKRVYTGVCTRVQETRQKTDKHGNTRKTPENTVKHVNGESRELFIEVKPVKTV